MAHRGASAAAPANTLAAFRKAVEMGADSIELDVHLSADGVPVVIHNFTVDETTDGKGPVSDLTLAELKRLDAGAKFGPAFAGERIPTLAEVFAAVGKRLLINIELKTRETRNSGLVPAVLDLIAQAGLTERVMLSSFNPLALRRCSQLAPHMRLGLIYAPNQPLWLRQGWPGILFHHHARHMPHSMVDARTMAWARRRGYEVNAWTVDEPAEMERLIALDVDTITTNTPDRLLRLLAGGRAG